MHVLNQYKTGSPIESWSGSRKHVRSPQIDWNETKEDLNTNASTASNSKVFKSFVRLPLNSSQLLRCPKLCVSYRHQLHLNVLQFRDQLLSERIGRHLLFTKFGQITCGTTKTCQLWLSNLARCLYSRAWELDSSRMTRWSLFAANHSWSISTTSTELRGAAKLSNTIPPQHFPHVSTTWGSTNHHWQQTNQPETLHWHV